QRRPGPRAVGAGPKSPVRSPWYGPLRVPAAHRRASRGEPPQPASRGMTLGMAPEQPLRPATGADTAFFGHPRGLSTLFFTEMWERFSYYGMRAILILFMTRPVEEGALGFSAAKGGLILALYVGTVYVLSLPGGWIADRFLGQRRSVLYGGTLIMFGH